MLGIAQIAQYEQTGIRDPSNPNQQQYIQYAQIPGGYSTWYVNKIPSTATLSGGGLGLAWTDISPTMQMLIVGAVGAAAGFFGWRQFGGSIKSKVGLKGIRRRRGR